MVGVVPTSVLAPAPAGISAECSYGFCFAVACNETCLLFAWLSISEFPSSRILHPVAATPGKGAQYHTMHDVSFTHHHAFQPQDMSLQVMTQITCTDLAQPAGMTCNIHNHNHHNNISSNTAQGFAERKLMLISEVVQACKKIHNDEIRKERLAALKTKQVRQHGTGPTTSILYVWPRQHSISRLSRGVPLLHWAGNIFSALTRSLCTRQERNSIFFTIISIFSFIKMFVC